MYSLYGNYIEEAYNNNIIKQIRELEEDGYSSIDEEVDTVEEAINMAEGFGGKLRPVFIVLLYSDSRFDHVAEKFVKNQQYWHASIGFGPALSRCYSFNFGECGANKFKGGLSFESLDFYKKEHPTGTMEVSCILLSTVKYNKLKATLDYYMQNKEKTKYSFINLVCSTFVDTILKSINVDVSGQEYSNLVKPDDLKASDQKSKQFKVFEGKIVDYKPTQVAKKVEKMYDDKSLSYFNKK